MSSELSAAVRLTRYTKRELDGITGGLADPFEVRAAGLEWLPKTVHFGVKQGDRLVAHAGWVPVPVEVGDARMQVAGIGGVIVAPELRGRGLARIVVEAAVEHARSTGERFGLLFCWPDRVPVYERLGWWVLHGDVQVDQPDGPVSMPLHGMWLPLHRTAQWPRGRIRLLSPPP